MKIEINKLTLPTTILIASIVLGTFYYVSQVSKQKSIEKQQGTKLQDDKRAEVFSNNLKCQTLLKDLKQRWNNVVGIYYDERENTCIVKYTKGGETEEAPIEHMQDD